MYREEMEALRDALRRFDTTTGDTHRLLAAAGRLGRAAEKLLDRYDEDEWRAADDEHAAIRNAEGDPWESGEVPF